MKQMLYDAPGVYDALYDSFSDDIPFYTDLARTTPGPVCELACGTGRVSVPLALAGVEVHGFDVSDAMLAAAEARPRARRAPRTGALCPRRYALTSTER